MRGIMARLAAATTEPGLFESWCALLEELTNEMVAEDLTVGRDGVSR
jgi:hypothetical protein